ncbi:UNVERIFIED_CONTAM: hypothetical protein RMT77_009978 [Armadillidium vulgare]
MGKIKQKRLKISRYSPTQLISKNKSLKNGDADNANTGSDASSSEVNGCYTKNGSCTINLPIGKAGLRTAYEKISSSSAEEKVTGLNMLAAFALEPDVAQSIIEDKMAASVSQLLNDKSSQVRLAAAGTLKNLCSCGSDDFIEMIVQQDVMQPLSQLLKSYENNTPSENPSSVSSLTYSKGVANSMDESDPHDLIFIHATNVLWSLCECNEEAVTLFNRENLVNILLKHINPFSWSYPLSLAAADCLLCVSENNPKILSTILPLAPTLLSLITKVFSSEYDPLGLHFAVVIAGVLLNVGYCLPDGDPNFHQISEILSKVLDINLSSLLQSKENNLKQQSVQEHFEHTITAQLIAFEILSNICFSEEDEYEEVSDDNEMVGFDECEPMDMENETPVDDNLDTVPVQVLESIKYHNLIAKTQSKIFEPEPNSIWRNEEDSKNALERVKQVKIRALQCFQNLVSCLPLDDLGGSESIYSTWLQLGQVCFSNSQMDSNMLDALSGAMRAIIEKLSEGKCEKLSEISDSDLQPIFSCILTCESPSVKANLCRMIGTLGLSVARQSKEKVISSSSQCSSLIASIANTLCKVGQNEESLYVQAESIDVIIDLFSDDKTDKIAAQIRLVETLKEIHPKFKAKFNQQRKSLGEHRPLLITVKDNLCNFIKYKASRTSKYLKMSC